MPRKVVVGPSISKAIGEFGLSRPVLLQLLGRIHTDFASHAAEFNLHRLPPDQRLFQYQPIFGRAASSMPSSSPSTTPRRPITLSWRKSSTGC